MAYVSVPEVIVATVGQVEMEVTTIIVAVIGGGGFDTTASNEVVEDSGLLEGMLEFGMPDVIRGMPVVLGTLRIEEPLGMVLDSLELGTAVLLVIGTEAVVMGMIGTGSVKPVRHAVHGMIDVDVRTSVDTA